MSDPQAVVAAALAQHECVLTREGERLVVLLDGRKVRFERGASRTADPFMSEADARAAFVAAIERALAEGFVAAHREPPRAPPPPRAFAPRAEPITFAPPPSPPRPAVPRPAKVWPLSLPYVQVEVGFDDPDWDDLFLSPPTPEVTHLEFEVFGELSDAVELIVRDGLPAWTRGLALASFEGLEDFLASELDAGAVWAACGHLERLELRAGSVHLPGQALSALRHLEVWSAHTSPEVIEALAAQPWPSLASLRLWLGREGQPGLPAEALEPLWRPGLFPALRSLAIEATSQNERLLARVEACGLAAQVQTLVLEGAAARGTVTPADGITVLSTDEFFPLRSGRSFTRGA